MTLAVLGLALGCGDGGDGVTQPVEGPGALEPGEQILTNGSVEQGLMGWSSVLAGERHRAEWTTDAATDGFHSLSIVSEGTYDGHFSFWVQNVEVRVETPVQLELQLQMRMEQVDGQGIVFVMHGDDTLLNEGEVETVATTEFDRDYTGTADWQPVSLVLPDVTSSVHWIRLYLILAPETTGTAYFDDIRLTVGQPEVPRAL